MDVLLVSAQTPSAERSQIEQVLAGHGVGIQTAASYKKAIEDLARSKFPVVVLFTFNASGDIGVTDAIRIMKQIVPDLSIIAVSEEKPLESERELRASGLYYYLTTPFSEKEITEALLGAIATQLRRKTR